MMDDDEKNGLPDLEEVLSDIYSLFSLPLERLWI